MGLMSVELSSIDKPAAYLFSAATYENKLDPFEDEALAKVNQSPYL